MRDLVGRLDREDREAGPRGVRRLGRQDLPHPVHPVVPRAHPAQAAHRDEARLRRTRGKGCRPSHDRQRLRRDVAGGLITT